MNYETRQEIKHAIMAIHHKGEYFQGMAILCRLVGWCGLVAPNPYDPPHVQEETRQEFSKWVKTMKES